MGKYKKLDLIFLFVYIIVIWSAIVSLLSLIYSGEDFFSWEQLGFVGLKFSEDIFTNVLLIAMLSGLLFFGNFDSDTLYLKVFCLGALISYLLVVFESLIFTALSDIVMIVFGFISITLFFRKRDPSKRTLIDE